jgi:hypothetical protein
VGTLGGHPDGCVAGNPQCLDDAVANLLPPSDVHAVERVSAALAAACKSSLTFWHCIGWSLSPKIQEFSVGQCSCTRPQNRSIRLAQGRLAPFEHIRRFPVRTLFPLFSTATYSKTAQTLDTYVIMELWNLPSDFSHSGVAHLLSTSGLQATAIWGGCRLWAVGCARGSVAVHSPQ